MIDPTFAVSEVNSWGVKHPKQVQRALDCCDALENAMPEPPGWEGLYNPSTVAEAVEANARYNAASGEAARTAYNSARFNLGKHLLTTVADNLDQYAKQWEPRFAKAAEAYETSAKELPAEFTANQVVTFSPERFEAYTRACEAVTELHTAMRWLQTISHNIPGQWFHHEQWAKEFLILEPGSVSSFATIQLADTRGADEALKKVDPVMLKAVHAGASLVFRLPAEALNSVRAWEERRQSLSDEQWARARAEVLA